MMDLRRPLLSGIDALQQLRHAAEEEARCLAAGAQAFLRKPFRPSDVLPLLPKVWPACWNIFSNTITAKGKITRRVFGCDFENASLMVWLGSSPLQPPPPKMGP
jgi:hypothetical protein